MSIKVAVRRGPGVCADRNGISTPIKGDFPPGCAEICNASIAVQRFAV